jgi:hypothetical protein
MDRLGLGYHLGAMLQDTIAANASQSSRAVFLLGDPTLRAYVTSPPMGLWGYSTNISGSYQVRLSWTDSTEEDGYDVYRGSSIESAQTNNIVYLSQSVTNYTDFTVQTNQTYTYLLRAVKPTATGAGAFYDLSRAATTNIYVSP